MGIITRLTTITAIVGLILVQSLVASADSQTFNANFFKPATGRNPYLMLHSTQTLHQLQFDVGNSFSYGYRPLDVRVNGVLQNVISNLLVSDFTAALGATDWLQFGVDLPVVLVNSFRDPYAPAGTAMVNHMSLSDLRFEAKARVLDACCTHVGLAFVPFITLPTGKDAYYVGDPGITGGIRVALDGRINRNIALTLNLGYQGGRKVQISNVEYQHRMLLGLGVWGTFPHGLDLFGEINADAALNKYFSDKDVNPAEILVGARWDAGKSGVTVQGGAGSCLVCGVKGARVRAVLGVKYRLNTPKYQIKDAQAGSLCMLSDAGLTKEQLYKLKANCPANPEDFVQGVNDDACPKFYELRELAGLILRCPQNPEDFDSRYHDQACPKVFTLSDSFTPNEIRDIVALSIAQMSLLCPSNPEDFNPQIHDMTCPKYYDLKETENLADRCPDPDKYQAGVDDPQCPKYYTLLDQYGEIDWKEVNRLKGIDLSKYGSGVLGGEIQTMRPVYFEFGQSVLLPTAQASLDEVIGVINATPWISAVRVAGHADAIGSIDANTKLSERRSQTVIDYMRSHGLRPNVQLIPVAYGAFRPAATNDTELGRSLNRRVVFTVSSYQIPRYTPPKKAQGQVQATEVPPGEAAPKQMQIKDSPEAPSRWGH